MKQVVRGWGPARRNLHRANAAVVQQGIRSYYLLQPHQHHGTVVTIPTEAAAVSSNV